MRLTLVLLAAAGCSTESIVETATGGRVKIEGENISIKTDKGEITTLGGDKGQMVITNEKGETATLTTEGESMKVTSKEGTATWGAKTLPKNFPLPLMPGASVESSAQMTSQGKGEQFHVTLKANQSADAVADFYEKALKDKGLTVQRSEHKMNADVMATLVGKKGKTEASLTAMQKSGEATMVMINWAAK